MSFTDVFTGLLQPPVYSQYANLTLTGDVRLSWPTQFQNINQVVANFMDIQTVVADLSIRMPDCTETSTGQTVIFSNIGGVDIAIVANDGTTAITTAVAGTARTLVLTSNSSVNGTWEDVPFGGGSPVITALTLRTNDAVTTANMAITIDGGGSFPITTAAVVDFDFKNPSDLYSLLNFAAATGVVAHTAVNTYQLKLLRGITGRIVIGNANAGSAGDITFNVADDLGLANPLNSVNTTTLYVTTIASPPPGTGAADITITPGTGTGNLIVNADLQLKRQTGDVSGITFYNLANSQSISFQAPDLLAASITYTWPTTNAFGGQVLAADTVTPNQLIWADVATSSAGVINHIATYSATGGGNIQSSPGIIRQGTLPVTFSGLEGLARIILNNNGANPTVTINSNLASGNIGMTVLGFGLQLSAPNGPGQGVILNTNSYQVPVGGASTLAGFFNLADTAYVGWIAPAAIDASIATQQVWALPPVDGDAGAFLVSNGVGQPISTLQFTKTITGATTAHDGLTVKRVPRAWVIFDGTAAPTIKASFNVTGPVIRNSIGNYSISFTTGFGSNNFGASATGNDPDGTHLGLVSVDAPAGGGFNVAVVKAYSLELATGVTALADLTWISVVFYGGI